MPIWANHTSETNISAKILAGIFASLVILSIILTFTVKRAPDPVYPSKWKEYATENITFLYPNNWSVTNDNTTKLEKPFDDVTMRTLELSAIGGNFLVIIYIIPKTDGLFLTDIPADMQRKTAVTFSDKEMGNGYQYLNENLTNNIFFIRGIKVDKGAEKNMKQIIEYIGGSVREINNDAK